MSHTISDLRIPLAYEVRLAPITTYSTGDYISRTIQYSERVFVFSRVYVDSLSSNRKYAFLTCHPYYSLPAYTYPRPSGETFSCRLLDYAGLSLFLCLQ